LCPTPTTTPTTQHKGLKMAISLMGTSPTVGNHRATNLLAGSQAITPTATGTTRAAMVFPATVAQAKQPAGTKNRAMAVTSSTRDTLAGKSTTHQRRNRLWH